MLCLCLQPHVCPPFRHTPFSFIICLQSCLVKSITKEKHFSRLGIYHLSFSRNFYNLEADQESCIFLYLEPDEMAQLHKPRSWGILKEIFLKFKSVSAICVDLFYEWLKR